MESQSFNLLSEDYDDVEYIELFGSEYLSMDSEFQREASIQKIEKVESPRAAKKAQAKYEREIAAKLTKYTLEPTFSIPTSVRARPIHIATSEMKVDKSNPSTSAQSNNTIKPTVEEDQPIQSTSTKPMSNNQRKREQYKLKRREIRHNRRPPHSAC